MSPLCWRNASHNAIIFHWNIVWFWHTATWGHYVALYQIIWILMSLYGTVCQHNVDNAIISLKSTTILLTLHLIIALNPNNTYLVSYTCYVFCDFYLPMGTPYQVPAIWLSSAFLLEPLLCRGNLYYGKIQYCPNKFLYPLSKSWERFFQIQDMH